MNRLLSDRVLSDFYDHHRLQRDVLLGRPQMCKDMSQGSHSYGPSGSGPLPNRAPAVTKLVLRVAGTTDLLAGPLHR